MLSEYDLLPLMYRATLVKNELILEEISPHVYRRVGTTGLGRNKVEAIEKLKRRMMDRFAVDLQAVNWQMLQYHHHGPNGSY